MKLRGSTPFYPMYPLPPRFHGSHPPSYKVGWDHRQSFHLKLLKWSRMKVATPLQDGEGCKSQLTKAQGKDSVILLYNRKYVHLCDVQQHSLWVIRRFFLKRNLLFLSENMHPSHGSASNFMGHVLVCGSSQKDVNDLKTLKLCPNPQEWHLNFLYLEGRDAVVYKNEKEVWTLASQGPML